MGAVYVTRAAWPVMMDNLWGRVVLTSSGSGIFGNFGQSNYASAKMSLIGLMKCLGFGRGAEGHQGQHPGPRRDYPNDQGSHQPQKWAARTGESGSPLSLFGKCSPGGHLASGCRSFLNHQDYRE